MNIKRTILIVEDDPNIRKMLVNALEEKSYRTYQSRNAQEAREAFNTHNPDLILLDLGLPDLDGHLLLKEFRLISQVPILVVSARFSENEKVKALDEGADDYLTKPFSLLELLARIRAHERKLNFKIEYTDVILNGSMTLDLKAHEVRIGNTLLNLTPLEYKLLELLAKHMDEVISYQVILNEVWGQYGNSIEGLRVFVTTLRRKIERVDPHHKYIHTHIGTGYRMIKLES